MGDEIHFRGHKRHPRREPPAPADSGIVERAEGGSSAATAARRKIGHNHGKITARIDAIAEIAEDSDHFVVAPSRIESRLPQEVGSPIEGISGAIKGVVQTTGGTGSIEEEVGRKAATTNGGLRPFNRGTYGKLAEILDHAEAVGALPSPAHDILRVDHERKCFLTIGDALPNLRHHAPHLASSNLETVRAGNVGPHLPLAEDIAVALAVVGSGAGPEEIAFVVASHLGAANRGLGQQREAGLPGGEVVL